MRNAMRKQRILRGFTAMLACALLLSACGKAENAAVPTTAAGQTVTDAETQTTAVGVTEAQDGQTQAAETGGAQVAPSSAQDNGSVQNGAGNANTAVPTTAAAAVQQPAEPAADTVTLTVSFQTAVDYGILNDPAFAGVLPANGYFLQNAAVEIEAGESALDVLKRTLRANHIVYSIASSSGYVRSIGGLAERDCGAQSGWLYRINGEFMNYSSKYCKLQAGDVLEFLYTCSPGDVGNIPF